MAPEIDIAPRRKLHAIIVSHPGAHLRELERRSGLAVGVLRHHLGYLADAGLIMEQRDGKLRRFFPVGLDPDLRQLLGILRTRSLRAVMVDLLTHPGATAKEIAQRQGFSLRSVAYHLRTLIDAGLVAKEKATYGLINADRAVRALVAYKPSFADRMVDAALEVWFDTGP